MAIRKANIRLYSSCAILLGLSGSPAAFAQGAPNITRDSTEILVTAQRRTENIQTVPIAVQAFSADALKEANVTSVRDLAVVAPTLQYSDSAQWAQLTLRGVGTAGIGPGIENPIALYVDGVYYAAMSSAALNFNNIAAIEVINGPQGTLFGRNATGGLVSVKTLDPQAGFSGNISATYGNYETASGSAYLSGGSDKVMANIAVQGQSQGKGYGKNLMTGTELDKNNNFGVRGKLFFLPTENLTIKLAGDYSWASTPYAASQAPGTTPAGGAPVTNPHDTNSPKDPYSKLYQGGVSVAIEYSMGAATLTNTTAWRSTIFDHQDASITSDPSYANVIHTHERHRQFSNELQLASAGTSPLTWTIGAFYFRETSKWDPASPSSGPNGGFDLSFADPTLDYNQEGSVQIFVNNVTESVAGYGQATYEVMPGTKLTAGLRYTHETHTFDSALLIGGNAFGYLTPDFGAFFPGGPAFQGRLSDNRLTWRLGLAQEFSSDVMAYASYNRGFRSGGYQSPTVDPLHPLKPEILDAYEVGIKSQLLDRRLTINLAGFYYDYKNMQVGQYANSFPTFVNGPKAEIYGMDLAVNARITPQFKISANLGLLHSRFVDFTNALAYAPNPNPPYGNLPVLNNADGNGYDATGNDLPHAPHVTANISPTYTVPIGTGNLTLAAAWSYNSGWYGDVDMRQKQKAYSVLNLSATYKTASGLGLSVWGRNVTDTTYSTFQIATPNHDMWAYAAPATYGVTISKEF